MQTFFLHHRLSHSSIPTVKETRRFTGTSGFRVPLFARLQGSSTAHGEQIWINTALLQQRADRFGPRQAKRYIVEPLASDVGVSGQAHACSYP